MVHKSVPDHAVFRIKHPGKNVFEYVIAMLTIFTLFELTLSYLYTDRGILKLETAAVLLLGFAFIKAGLVAGFFMHMFYEKKPFQIFLISFGFPILIALPIVIVAMTV